MSQMDCPRGMAVEKDDIMKIIMKMTRKRGEANMMAIDDVEI